MQKLIGINSTSSLGKELELEIADWMVGIFAIGGVYSRSTGYTRNKTSLAMGQLDTQIIRRKSGRIEGKILKLLKKTLKKILNPQSFERKDFIELSIRFWASSDTKPFLSSVNQDYSEQNLINSMEKLYMFMDNNKGFEF